MPKNKFLLQESEDSIEDPVCNPHRPVKISFEEITSAAYRVRSGILNTPCIVSTYYKHYFSC